MYRQSEKTALQVTEVWKGARQLRHRSEQNARRQQQDAAPVDDRQSFITSNDGPIGTDCANRISIPYSRGATPNSPPSGMLSMFSGAGLGRIPGLRPGDRESDRSGHHPREAYQRQVSPLWYGGDG